jgi:AhpD family alkylhydroperoxidase
MSVLMKAHPLIGPALAELFMPVMFAPGALARPEREMIAAVAAAAQDCHYWTQSHAEFLRAEGEDSELIEAIQERRWRELRRLAARERALCAIAEKLSATAPRVTVEDWRAPHIATTTLIGLTK